MCETENRVCGKTLTFLSDIGGDRGSSVKTGSTLRLSRNVAPSTLNRSRTTGNAHTSALLVVWNLENVVRFVGGWLLHSLGSSSIFDDHDRSSRVWRCGSVFSPSINTASHLLLKMHLTHSPLHLFHPTPPWNPSSSYHL